MCIWMSKYACVCVFVLCCGCAHTLCVCVGLRGMWLEKYRVFYVVFALCFTVSLVGGWLNESFGQRLRYQKQRFGLAAVVGVGVGWGAREKENQLVLVASGFRARTTAQ